MVPQIVDKIAKQRVIYASRRTLKKLPDQIRKAKDSL